MVQIKVHSGENIERALRRFKKKYEKAGIYKDVRKNEYFIKPSANRRMKRAIAKRRMRRNMAYNS